MKRAQSAPCRAQRSIFRPFVDTRFAAALLRGASFAGNELDQVDLAYADLAGGNLSNARASRKDKPTSLFLAELRKANLRGSKWVLDEERRYPSTSGWLCRTTMPDGGIDIHTVARVVAAGASIIVAGSAIFHSPDAARATRELKAAAAAAVPVPAR